MLPVVIFLVDAVHRTYKLSLLPPPNFRQIAPLARMLASEYYTSYRISVRIQLSQKVVVRYHELFNEAFFFLLFLFFFFFPLFFFVCAYIYMQIRIFTRMTKETELRYSVLYILDILRR